VRRARLHRLLERGAVEARQRETRIAEASTLVELVNRLGAVALYRLYTCAGFVRWYQNAQTGPDSKYVIPNA
jgi:hypothetical protein